MLGLKEANPKVIPQRILTKFNLSWLTPVLFFTLLTAFYTYPMVFQFTTAVVGKAGLDRGQNLWNLWWIEKALTHLDNPYHTNMLYYPYFQPPEKPLPLYFHTLQLFNGVASMPLQWLGGLAAAFNGLVFGATFLSGLGTYALVRRLGSSQWAGFVAGSIYAFAPFRLWTIERSYTNIQSTQFLPLYTFYLLGFEKSASTKKNLAGAILCLTFCIYNDWYNTIYLLVFTGFYFGWRLIGHFQEWKRILTWIGVIGVCSFVLVTPLLLPILTNLNDPNFKVVPGYDRDIAGSTNLTWLFLPAPILKGATSFLGYTGLVLSLITGLSLFERKQLSPGWLSRSARAFWLLLAVLSLLLSLGPELQLDDSHNTGIFMPYALFRLLPMVSITNYPDRFLILMMLAVGVLAAYAVDWLRTASGWSRLPRRLNGPKLASGLLTGIILAVLILETWSPMNTFEYKHNSFIESLKNEPGDFHLLELPLNRQYRLFSSRMYNQLVHGRPILGGYLSRLLATDPYRTPDAPLKPVADLVLTDDKIHDIIRVNSNQDDLDDVAYLYNFRYIVLYLNEFSEEDQLEGVINLIETHYGKQQLVYKDEEMQVYRVPDTYLTEHTLEVHLALGEGWYPTEQDSQSFWRWSKATSFAYATSTSPQKVQIEVKLRPFARDRTLQILVSNRLEFQAKISAGPAQTFSFPLNLPAGRSELKLNSLDGDQSPAEIDPASKDDRRLAFAVDSIQIKPVA